MPPQFGRPTQRFVPGEPSNSRNGTGRIPPSSLPVPTPPSVGNRPSTTLKVPSRPIQSGGLGKGKGAVGLGRGKGALKRHKKVHRDTIKGISKGDIRRLARRGGIKRISGDVYESIRDALRDRLRRVLEYAAIIVESDPSNRKTVTVRDVIFSVSRLGNPIYGYDVAFNGRVRND